MDFGGGFGIPYFEGEHELDMDQLRVEVASWPMRTRSVFTGRFVVEPGRYLVSEAGIPVR